MFEFGSMVLEKKMKNWDADDNTNNSGCVLIRKARLSRENHINFLLR